MLSTAIKSTELEGRFDPKYYNPSVISLLRKIESRSKEKGFKCLKVKDFGSTSKGIFSILASEYVSSGTPFIRVACIKNLTVDLNDLTYITKTRSKIDEKTEVEPGDIVVSKSGTIGHVALIPEWLGTSNISQDIIGLYVSDKNYSGFLAAYLASMPGQMQMNRAKTQQTHAHLNLPELRNLKILLNDDIVEDVSKKMNIAMKFDKVTNDFLMQARDLVKAAIDIPLPSARPKSFTITSKKLESKFTPTYYYPPYLMTNDALKTKFKTIKLGKISEIISGDEVGSANYNSSGIPFIRTSDFVNWGIDRDAYHKVSQAVFDKYRQDLLPNDILFTNDGKIGLTAMLVQGDKCVIQSHIKRIRITDPNLTPEYIFSFLNTEYGRFQIARRIFVQSTIPTIENGLEELDIPFIPSNDMKLITEKCKKAFISRNMRNKLVEKSKDLVENMFIN